MAAYPADHELLDKVDVTSWESKLAVVALFFVLTGTVYGAIYLLLHALWETFRSQLSQKDKLIWCRALTVSVFAVVTSSISIWYAAVDDTLVNDVVYGTSTLSFLVICSSVGFYTFDIMVLVATKSRKPALVHHVSSILGQCICVHYGKGHYFGVQGLLFEVTVLFKCFGWMLSNTKMKHSSIWRINQYFAIHLFHCRSVLELYWIYKVFQNWDYIIAEMPICTAVLPLCTWFAGSLFWFTPHLIYQGTKLLFEHELEQQRDGFSHDHHLKPEIQHAKQE